MAHDLQKSSTCLDNMGPTSEDALAETNPASGCHKMQMISPACSLSYVVSFFPSGCWVGFGSGLHGCVESRVDRIKSSGSKFIRFEVHRLMGFQV